MNIDKEKLKALAQAVADLEDIPEREDEHAEAVDALWLNVHCHTILALLAEIERLEDSLHGASAEVHGLSLQSSRACRARDEARTERDQLKAENEALRKALGNLLSLYEEDEGCRSLPQYTAGVAAMAKEASHG